MEKDIQKILVSEDEIAEICDKIAGQINNDY